VMDRPGFILVVDDDPTNVLLLSKILTKEGHRVETARSGAECLELLQNELPDLILLDVRMPGMDGFEVCRRLKADTRTADIPVIFLTAEGRSDENVSAGFGAGACDYVTKPFSRVDVIARVQVPLRQRAVQRAYIQLAGQDPLTGLLNRRGASERMAEIFSYSSRHHEPVSIIMADLDKFKTLNDTFGHDFGDTVLIAFGELLQTDSRTEDVICRYGGEEFVIVLRNTDEDLAYSMADRFRCRWAEKVHKTSDGGIARVTASFGVASWQPGEGTPDWQDLLKRADMALYAAKNAGRNRVVRFGRIAVLSQ